MMAGGGDGTDSTARVLVRRPTIRPRPVTPPRSAQASAPARAPTPTWKLPPVRLPSPRPRFITQSPAEVRPALLLVADASDQFDLALRHDRDSSATTSARRRRSLRTAAMVGASGLVLLAVVVAVGAALASAARTAPVAQATHVTQATRALPPPTATSLSRAPKSAPPALPVTAPVIPLVDVKSLPPAR